MKRLVSLISLIPVLVLGPALASAAQPIVYVHADDQFTQETVSQMVSNAGYETTPNNPGLAATGYYVIRATRNLSGGDREDGSTIFGGAFVIVAYFHCARYVDLYIGQLTSGFHALDETLRIGGDLSQMTNQTFQVEVGQLTSNDVWKDAPRVCQMFVKKGRHR